MILRTIYIAAWLAFMASISQAQPDAPFTLNEHTRGLWHMDNSLPEFAEAILPDNDRNEVFTAAIKSREGNFLVLGDLLIGENETRPMLVKMTPEGEVLWSHEYVAEEGLAYECNDLAELRNGNIVLAGRVISEMNQSMLLMMLNENGELTATHTYTEGFVWNCAHTVLANEADEIIFGGSDILQQEPFYVCKVNAEGEVQWVFTSPAMECFDIIRTKDEGYLAVGYNQEMATTFGYVAKLTENGELEWEQQNDFQNRRAEYMAAVETEDGYICVGQHTAPDSFVFFDTDIWMVSYDLEGNQIEDVTLARERLGASAAQDAILGNDGNITITGWLWGENGMLEPAVPLVKINPDCKILWAEAIRTDSESMAEAIIQNPDHSYSLLGAILEDEDQSSYQGMLLKTTPDISFNGDASVNSNFFRTVGVIDTAEGRWGEALDISSPRGGLAVVPDNASLRPEQFSLQTWFKLNTEIEQSGVIASKLIDEAQPSFMLVADNFNDRLEFAIQTESNTYNLARQCSLNDGEWHYAAADYNGHRIRLVFDGVLLGRMAVEGAVVYDEGALVLGSDMEFTGSEFQFYGCIDEVLLADTPLDNVGINEIENPELPDRVVLCPPFPNPFNSTANITYDLVKPGFIQVMLFDARGRQVGKLFDGYLEAGRHSTIWRSEGAAGGSYFIHLKTAEQTRVQPVRLEK